MTGKTETPKDLRTQVIEAMAEEGRRAHGWDDSTIDHYVIAMFDDASMPVLQSAMDAGLLLVGRNTTRVRISVPEAVKNWVQGVSELRPSMQRNEPTASKRALLNVIYFLCDQADQICKDVYRIEQSSTEH